MTSSMPWNGPWFAMSETWMDSLRVYDNLKSTYGYLMASRSFDHSFERTLDECLEYGDNNGVELISFYSRYRCVCLHIKVNAYSNSVCIHFCRCVL